MGGTSEWRAREDESGHWEELISAGGLLASAKKSSELAGGDSSAKVVGGNGSVE